MGIKLNIRIITKNHEADPEKGFLKETISKPYGRATAMPPAWELRDKSFKFFSSTSSNFIILFKIYIIIIKVTQ